MSIRFFAHESNFGTRFGLVCGELGIRWGNVGLSAHEDDFGALLG